MGVVLTHSASLLGQLEFFSRQAEMWKSDHRHAMASFDLEADISLGLGIFQLLKTVTERFNLEHASFDEPAAREISALFEKWCEHARPLLDALKRLTAGGIQAARADEFVSAYAAASIPAFQFDQVMSAVKQFERGRGKSEVEAKDELRRRMVR